MMKNQIILLMGLCILFAGCNGKTQGSKLTNYGNLTEEEDNTVVNVIEQAKPTIMVIPSDKLLQQYDALQVVTKNGANVYVRDYAKYLLDNPNNKVAISAIQNEFVQMQYPLTDLEQTLKSLSNKQAHNLADDVEQDAKTLLLQTASPDIIIELDYDFKMNATDPNFSKKLTYTLSAFDSYTNKAFSTKTNSCSGSDFNELFSKSIHKEMKSILPEVNEYFKDIVVHGREITVRFSVKKGLSFNLSSESISGDTYSDWIMDYMDSHTKKGTYKLQNNTDYELYFTNVRISTLRPDGTQNSAYNWARELIKEMKKDCGVKCTNKVQGLGDVHIMIKGM
jgi:hypothetical protein